MQNNNLICHWFLSVLFALSSFDKTESATEFTFDLPDSAQECFYEDIPKDTNCTLEYHVVSGGQLDVDVLIENPSEKKVYEKLRTESDVVKFTTEEAGEYMFCFSNKFSTFTDKSVFVSFESGPKEPIFQRQDEDSNSTYIDDSADIIHDHLYDVINGQTQYRLQEAYGRRYAKELNERVMWWSLSQTILVLIIGGAQVLVVRRLFADPKPSKPTQIYEYQTAFYVN